MNKLNFQTNKWRYHIPTFLVYRRNFQFIHDLRLNKSCIFRGRYNTTVSHPITILNHLYYTRSYHITTVIYHRITFNIMNFETPFITR
ncbi:hypothetical protein HanIR_Chr08g0381051 [Helianthus annuus]|nr:hypothetical protein HanIR_Chr08g0381051 [Helianthus annuus]